MILIFMRRFHIQLCTTHFQCYLQHMFSMILIHEPLTFKYTRVLKYALLYTPSLLPSFSQTSYSNIHPENIAQENNFKNRLKLFNNTHVFEPKNPYPSSEDGS